MDLRTRNSVPSDTPERTPVKHVHAENESSGRERIAWIDICKGITIILVILGQIGTIPAVLRVSIFSFHMPLFMILNGYLIHSYDIKKTFVNSVKSLLKPYAVICLLEAALAAFCATDIGTAGKTLFDSLNDMVVGMSYISTMYNKYNSVWLVWFVCCLFLSRNLYVLVRAACAKMPVSAQTAIFVMIAAMGCYIGKELAYLPWSLDVAMASVVFIAFGDFLRTHPFEKQKYALWALSFVCWGFLLYRRAWIELATRSYRHGVLCFLCAMAGSVVMIAVSKGIAGIPCFSRGGLLAWAGKNSIVILGVHCLEVRFFNWRQWLYEPLGISPSWLPESLIHCSLILLTAYGFLQCRKHILKINIRLRQANALQTKGNRLDWPDVAKGICIISVILGHQGIPWINQIVYTYHLPVFFIIAGYFFKKTDHLELIKSKARRLLVPYALTSVIMGAMNVAKAWYKGTPKNQALFTALDAALYGAGGVSETPFHINSIGAIWFLWALFFASLIFNYFIEKKYDQIILASIAFMGWSTYNVTKIWLPLSVQAGMLACIYLLIGYEYRKSQMANTPIGTTLFLALFLIMVCGIQNFEGIWLVHDHFGNGLFDFFVTIAASAVVIAFSGYICRTSEWIKRAFIFFGKNSLVILCAHLVDLNVLNLRGKIVTVASLLHINNNHTNLLTMLACIAYTALIAASLEYLKRKRLIKQV